MKKLFIIILVILTYNQLAYAGRILRVKKTGEYLVGWYKSHSEAGVLLSEGVKMGGLKVKEIEEVIISDSEWKKIWSIYSAALKESKDAEKKDKKEELKKKFGWTDEDIEKLREVLK